MCGPEASGEGKLYEAAYGSHAGKYFIIREEKKIRFFRVIFSLHPVLSRSLCDLLFMLM